MVWQVRNFLPLFYYFLGCLSKAKAFNSISQDFRIDQCILGHVLAAGCGQAPATQALKLASLPTNIPAFTVNKVCASGMKALTLSAALIRSGECSSVVTGGMESMSGVPFALPTQLRCPNRGLRYGNSQLIDLLALDGLTDPSCKAPMGEAAERIAEKYNFSRQEMDEYSKRSFELALASADLFREEEIVAVPATEANAFVHLDDGPGTFKPDKLASLRTPFRPENGRVTAATSSQLTDGAAALLLMSSAEAGRVGITAPLAKIISWADSALLDAMEFPVAPIDAIKTALSKANLSVEEVDLFEINEAFAVVPMAFMADLNIGLEKVNVLGGALALGHPLGASGARIVGTLITALRCKKKRIGCAAICNGGGGATALILELLLQ